jgi:[ribosomal protein S5]-alanine N-acetyltransferase
MTDLHCAQLVHCDPATNRFNPSGPPSPLRVKEMLDSWIEHWSTHGFGYWFVALPDRPELALGFGGIMRRALGPTEGLNLYFRLAPAAWGNGYAMHVARASLKLAFEALDAQQVLAKVRPENAPSRRTLERAGLEIFGAADDVPGHAPSLLYAMVKAKYPGGSARRTSAQVPAMKAD